MRTRIFLYCWETIGEMCGKRWQTVGKQLTNMKEEQPVSRKHVCKCGLGLKLVIGFS